MSDNLVDKAAGTVQASVDAAKEAGQKAKETAKDVKESMDVFKQAREEIKTKVEVMRYVGGEMQRLYEDFNKIDMKEKFSRIFGIFAIGMLGLMMDKEEFDKYKLERMGVKDKTGTTVRMSDESIRRYEQHGKKKGFNLEVKKTREPEKLAQEHRQNMQYLELWPGKTEKQVDNFKEKYEVNKHLYEGVSNEVDMPPLLIAAIHKMESEMNFGTYLHNGQPLGEPTTIHPPGILFPKGKKGWRESAIHALGGNINDHSHPPKPSLKYFQQLRRKFGINKNTTDMGKIAAFAEAYNGYGYRNKGKRTGYVYGGTNLTPRGRFVADGKFDRTKISQRVGVAGLILGAQGRIRTANEKYLMEAEKIEVARHKNRVLTYPIQKDRIGYLKHYNVNEERVKPTIAKYEGVVLRETLKRGLDEANELARKDGYQIIPASGYRSPEAQKDIFEAAKKKHGKAARKWAAPPGNSWHQSGGAVDLALYKLGDKKNRLSAATSDEMKEAHREPYNKQLEKYMNAVGFVRLQNEAWHFEIGTVYWVKIMQKQGILKEGDARLMAYVRQGNKSDLAYHQHSH